MLSLITVKYFIWVKGANRTLQYIKETFYNYSNLGSFIFHNSINAGKYLICVKKDQTFHVIKCSNSF